jgi:hypothetical protein
MHDADGDTQEAFIQRVSGRILAVAFRGFNVGTVDCSSCPSSYVTVSAGLHAQAAGAGKLPLMADCAVEIS